MRHERFPPRRRTLLAVLGWLVACHALFAVRTAAADACSFTLDFKTSYCENVEFSYGKNGATNDSFGVTSVKLVPVGVEKFGVLTAGGYSGSAFAAAANGRLRVKSFATRAGLPAVPDIPDVTSVRLAAISSASIGDFETVTGPVGAATTGIATIDVDGILSGDPAFGNPIADVTYNVTLVKNGCLACQTIASGVGHVNPATGKFRFAQAFAGVEAGDQFVWVINLRAVAGVSSDIPVLNSSADLSNTLHFNIDFASPDFAAVANSGHDYRTSPVPLPGAGGLLALALGTLGVGGGRRAGARTLEDAQAASV